MTEVAVGRVAKGHTSPANLARGEAGEAARRGRRPKTRMAVFLFLMSPLLFPPPLFCFPGAFSRCGMPLNGIEDHWPIRPMQLMPGPLERQQDRSGEFGF